MDSLSELDYKANIFVTGIDERVKDSVSLIKNDYPAFQQLEHAMEFMSICHSDAVKSDIENLESRVLPCNRNRARVRSRNKTRTHRLI